MKMPRRNLFFAVAALTSATVLFAQKPPSPPGKAEVVLAGKSVTIDYSRPSMRGRKIMGALVPYGEVWRTGANEATLLKTAIDLEIGGAKVPAGSYTLFTLPSESAWKLIINKQTGQSGLDYNKDQDLARVDLVKTALASPLEQFTIELVKKGADSADLILEWETTKLSVPVRVAR
jgi:hypothetical protein